MLLELVKLVESFSKHQTTHPDFPDPLPPQERHNRNLQNGIECRSVAASMPLILFLFPSFARSDVRFDKRIGCGGCASCWLIVLSCAGIGGFWDGEFGSLGIGGGGDGVVGGI